jgi:predicted dehydrogenase
MTELAQGTGRKRRVGIVGAGRIAPHHLAALRRVPNAIVSGVFDVVPEKAHALAEPEGLAVASSLDTLCEVADVIHVLTPPDAHVAVALSALAHGCDLYVEKPLALDVADCRRLRDAAHAAGRRVNVGHSLLFDPQIRALLAAVASGAIGRIVSVDILRSSVLSSATPASPFATSGSTGFRSWRSCSGRSRASTLRGRASAVIRPWPSTSGALSSVASAASGTSSSRGMSGLSRAR